MEVEAKNSSAKDVNPYAAIGKFFKSHYYYNLTSLMGDIPMKEALSASMVILFHEHVPKTLPEHEDDNILVK